MLSHVRFFVTPWTAAHWAPLTMRFFTLGVGCQFLLQGIFPIQGSNPHLHTRCILYLLSHLGRPSKMSWKVWKCKLLWCNLKMLHYNKQVKDVFSILKNGSIVYNSRFCGTLTLLITNANMATTFNHEDK